MYELAHLHNTARAIFFSGITEAKRLQSALLPISGNAAKGSLAIPGSNLDRVYEGNLYAIAIGKAATEMAAALDRKLGRRPTDGVIAVPQSIYTPSSELGGWRTFAAGHPLPNEASLAAAQAAFELLDRANSEEASVVFLISGGGSAVMEWPANDRITLEDLREANRLLISCGATIGEINAVRRAFSAVKGGKLAARAPKAHQVTMIVSDVNRGQEHNVASGPTLVPPAGAPDPREVVERYRLTSSFPSAVLASLRDAEASTTPALQDHASHVLVDSQHVLEHIAANLRGRGFPVELAIDICEQLIAEGCELLLSRATVLLEQSRIGDMPACLISGGEFSCPVQGSGIGGRNLETALRCAIALDESQSHSGDEGTTADRHIVLLSAGTDGIDGNSRVAGAIVDETTLARGRALGLEADLFLANSDAFNYFNALGDALITGPTATNVRDLRVMLVSA
ncbi:MAG: glycerate 2-kinase [Blastocatellia bacterium]|nr:glycerate 2-kinase [Blastocatellia bacterium]